MLRLKTIEFTLGGVQYSVTPNDEGPETTLNAYLRDKVHLTGTKRMCLEGGCGTCTVAVEENVKGKTKVFSVNSCLVPLLACHGWKIHSIEGVGNPLMGYSPIQKILAENYGTQCGFCSPGMVMNMYALQKSGSISEQQIENSFGGNICRCTGYRPILHAFRQLATSNDKELPDIEELNLCSKKTGAICTKDCKTKTNFYLEDTDNYKWIKVHALQDLIQVLKVSVNSSYILVSGSTARGVYKDAPLPYFYIDIRDVAELIQFSITDDVVNVGGNVTITTFTNICNVASQKSQFSYLKTVVKHLDLVATVQIRNVGSLAGNLMIKHEHNEFPSDIFLLLETFNATLVIVDVDGNEYFRTPLEFLAMDMRKNIIKNIVLNALDSSYKFSTYKIMPRAQNAHAMVNAGFLFKLLNNNVKSARIVYGGINPKFVHASKTEAMLVGQNLYTNATLQKVFDSLNAELNPDYVLPDPIPEYRKNLAIALFYKFALNTCPPGQMGDRFKSGGEILSRALSTGVQEYTTNKQQWPLTKPLLKIESMAQTSGRLEYIIDMPALPNEVHAAFVTAKASAGSKILKIDATKALKSSGVVAYYGAKDIPGRNVLTPINTTMEFSVEEELFCSGTVQYYNQPVGIIVAKTEKVAWSAAELVQIEFSPPASKPYLDVRDVVADNIINRITHEKTYLPKGKGNDIKKIIKGEFYIGMQYHYHMETQGCKVIPIDDAGLEVFATTQWLDATQQAISSILNMPTNKITVKVRQLGGAFGAKILRNVFLSASAALAAIKLRVPVKMFLSFEQNMNILGKRFPLFMKYEVGVNDTGVIQYLKADLYSDAGIGGNEPFESLLASSFENCYNISTWEFSTYNVKTDMHANAYARGPGTAEGLAAIENIMEHIAKTLNLDPMAVKLANNSAETSPGIPNYWTNLENWADIDKRREEINKFNQANRWTKRGMAVVPMRWILEVKFCYSVVVSIFHGDGGVAISHGGIEIGQGINTKVVQVCAYKFGIDISKVSVKPSYNLIAPNSFCTGGSATSESVCYAVIQACDTLLARMKPTRDKMNNPTWEELVEACYANKIQLTTTGYFSPLVPKIQNYPIFGICATSVEIDILTGSKIITQVDIIEDLGQSMSPIIDIGQIEGAFVMGLGYHTLEEIIFDKEGKLYTNRTWNYKPPTAKDIPVNFRIKFAENSFNPSGVLNSKAVAEPPLCLSVCVALAIRNAIISARQENNPRNDDWIPFDGPTTVEKTFLYSLNDYKQYVLK